MMSTVGPLKHLLFPFTTQRRNCWRIWDGALFWNMDSIGGNPFDMRALILLLYSIWKGALFWNRRFKVEYNNSIISARHIGGVAS